MGKYSSVVNGKVLDWSWKRRKQDTVFYIGDKIVGQLFYLRSGWSAVHTLPSTTGGPVQGFRSRIAASMYLEQIEKMHQKPNS